MIEQRNKRRNKLSLFQKIVNVLPPNFYTRKQQSNRKIDKRAGVWLKLVECLPSKHKFLSSN
jgi:hypothetical protein